MFLLLFKQINDVDDVDDDDGHNNVISYAIKLN